MSQLCSIGSNRRLFDSSSLLNTTLLRICYDFRTGNEAILYDIITIIIYDNDMIVLHDTIKFFKIKVFLLDLLRLFPKKNYFLENLIAILHF
jgi:hypothetical protein